MGLLTPINHFFFFLLRFARGRSHETREDIIFPNRHCRIFFFERVFPVDACACPRGSPGQNAGDAAGHGRGTGVAQSLHQLSFRL
jgi:hypothetical protein